MPPIKAKWKNSTDLETQIVKRKIEDELDYPELNHGLIINVLLGFKQRLLKRLPQNIAQKKTVPCPNTIASVG